jgi:FlgD Ig-like domain/Cohesin domain/Bacterial Ig domain
MVIIHPGWSVSCRVRVVIKRVGKIMSMRKIYTAVALTLLVLASLPANLYAWSDAFGIADTFRIESVSGSPGQNVTVRFVVFNDETLGSLSVPIKYDTSILTLTGVSFGGGRVDYLGTKLLNPETASATNGHFLVGAIVLQEALIPPGSGSVFSATFKISPSATMGAVARLDTLFFPPGGDLIFAEGATSGTILPVFVGGSVTVAAANSAPSIAPIPALYIFEGDALAVPVHATDPDGNNIQLSCPTKPTGALFTSNGSNGQFAWTPGFTGSFSSDGSPFKVVVSAHDGFSSTQREVQVNVLNRNRRPTVESQSTLSITAGHLIQIPVSVVEPDFESITWTVLGAPSGSEFDLAAKGGFVWQTTFGDTGIANVTFIATDPHGASDTSVSQLTVNPAQLYTLAIDTVEGNPGDVVNLTVSLTNVEPVAGFNLLIHLDGSALTLASPILKGARNSDWELLNFTNNAGGINGNIRIVGGADQPTGAVVPPLAPGSGPILVIPIRIAANVGLGGFSVPVRFTFEDAPAYNDNTLISPTGIKIIQQDIDYADGEVFVKSMGTVMIGDINLNGIPAEVSDIILFSNWIVNPSKDPWNALQYANSDVNGDGYLGSIADLIALIQWVVTGDAPGKIVVGNENIAAKMTIIQGHGATTLKYASDNAVGGMLVTIISPSPINENMIAVPSGMSSVVFHDGTTARILIYSMQGASLPAGTETALIINGSDDAEITSVEMATSAGVTMTTTLEKVASLPTHFALEQNYPNPFNPTTQISFSLPDPQRVRLVVYNILGETITTLADGQYPAGSQTVTWDGRSAQGSAVASGVYFYRLESGGKSLTRKMMLVK